MRQNNVNVIEVTQSVLQDMFAMIMLVDTSKMSCDFARLQQQLVQEGEALGLSVHVMHEDIFQLYAHHLTQPGTGGKMRIWRIWHAQRP